MPEKFLPSEESKELPSDEIKKLPTGAGEQQERRFKSYRERLEYYTRNGGLEKIPDGYDEENGDWRHILSENPFEVLYLDYREIDKIRGDKGIIERNYEVLKGFWREKQSLYNMGANKILMERKYGRDTISKSLTILEMAYRRLMDDLEGEYKRMDGIRFERGREFLERALSYATADKILTKEEEREIVEQAKRNTELSEGEIKKIIDEYLQKTNSKRAEIQLTQEESEIEAVLKFQILERKLKLLKREDEDKVFNYFEDKISSERFNEIVIKILKKFGDVEREKTLESDKRKYRELYFSLLAKYGLNQNDEVSPEFLMELVRKTDELNIFLTNETKNKIEEEVKVEYKTKLYNEILKFEKEAYEKLKERKNARKNIEKLLNSPSYELLLPHMRQEIIEKTKEKLINEQTEMFKVEIIEFAKKARWKIKEKDKGEFVKMSQKYDWLEDEYIDSIIEEAIETIKQEYQKEREKFNSTIVQKLNSFQFGLPVDVQNQVENDPGFHLDIVERREMIIKLEEPLRQRACSEFESYVKKFVANDTIIPTIEEHLLKIGEGKFILSESKNNISFSVKTSKEIINSLRHPFNEVSEEKIKELANSKKIDEKLKNKYKLPYSSYISTSDFELFAKTFLPTSLNELPSDVQELARKELFTQLDKLCEKYKIYIVDKPKIEEFNKLLDQSIAEISNNFRLRLSYWFTPNFISEVKQISSVYGIPEAETTKFINDIPQNYKRWTTPDWKKFIIYSLLITSIFTILRLLMLFSGNNIYTIHPDLLTPVHSSEYITFDYATYLFKEVLWLPTILITVIAIYFYKKYFKRENENANLKYAEFWYKKGIELHENGKYQDAISCYDKAIEINPKFAKAWYNKGVTLHKLGKYSEARNSFENFIKYAKPEDKDEVKKVKKIINEIKGL
jgi:hypothetical protein